MIEVFLLFCFVAILSALVGAIRGAAFLIGMVWKKARGKASSKEDIG